MTTPPPPPTPAGWYPDPDGAPGQQRYWNGSSWGIVGPPTPVTDSKAPTKLFWIVVLGIIALIYFVPKVVESNQEVTNDLKEICSHELGPKSDNCDDYK